MIIEFLTSGLLGFWLQSAGITEPQPKPASPIFPTAFLKSPDAERDRRIDSYLDNLAQSGFAPQQQGLWLQTDQELLVDRQGDQLQTPASLTKVATTLAALKTWGLAHRFTTELWAMGPVVNGVLEGDLRIQGDGDPLLATPEAIALAQQLNTLGIRRVTGNLIVAGAFSVNFATDLQTSGETLKTLWNESSQPQVA
ncbi:MAG: D-alanyl-D-alanine carboxypeptidase, partial [Thermosynechococcaceae cyanobacterium]